MPYHDLLCFPDDGVLFCEQRVAWLGHDPVPPPQSPGINEQQEVLCHLCDAEFIRCTGL